MVDCFMRPIRLALLSSNMLTAPDKLNNLWIMDRNCYNCYFVNRQINVSYYQPISNCCRPVLTYWPIDWCHQWLTNCWSRTAFCCNSFSLLWVWDWNGLLCAIKKLLTHSVVAVVYSGSWDFLYGQCKQLFVSELNHAYFSRHLF